MDDCPAQRASNWVEIGMVLNATFNPKIKMLLDSGDYFFGRNFHFQVLFEQIMVLNLSSGVEAALANKFINKALEFKPKILLLILPQEAQRYLL